MQVQEYEMPGKEGVDRIQHWYLGNNIEVELRKEGADGI